MHAGSGPPGRPALSGGVVVSYDVGMTVQTDPQPPDDRLAAGAAPPPPGQPDAPAARIGAALAAGSATRTGTSPAHEGSYRDTVESILIAFILAFVFRTFVVEAFVIPTGSMAPTLLGAHARFTCPDCGYQFEANFSSGNPSDDQSIPARVPHHAFPQADCPNCAYAVHDPRDKGRNERSLPPVPIHYGDRILVLKYAYLLNQPRRWDVVVFKNPDTSNEKTGWYTTNYIKRLVGNPGETLMVLDGDIYVSKSGPDDLANFEVQSKPRHLQDALWRIVYDNDFLPGPRDDWTQPWKPETAAAGWDLGTHEQPQRVFTFDRPQGAGTIVFNAEANEGRAFTDWLAYVQSDRGWHHVSDVKVSLLYERSAGEGPLRLQLTKLDDTFTAELSPQGAALYRKTGKPSGPDDLGEQIAGAGAAGIMDGPVMIEFMNVDYGVTLRVGGDDILSAEYEPDIAALKAAGQTLQPKPEVRITAANQVCSISRLSVWRDVYYTNSRPGGGILWGTPDSPITLGPDEYFVMGDNTVISQDARFWVKGVHLPGENLKSQPGVVPGRFLLGKAFFVYWPAGYRPIDAERVPGIIPNFGDMRLIH